jgi:hypothetical protein
MEYRRIACKILSSSFKSVPSKAEGYKFCTLWVRERPIYSSLPSALQKLRKRTHLQQIMESEKVQDSGLLCGKRGGFFIVDVDAPEELFELLGPEIYANLKTDVRPVALLERIGELSQQ